MKKLGLRRWLMAASLVLGCGPIDDVELVEEPVAIVFQVDHLDVYGTIDLLIDGYQELQLVRGEEASCDDPHVVASATRVSFEGLSERHFYWEGNVDLLRDEACRVIPLGFEQMSAGFIGYSLVLPERCFPVEGFVSMNGPPEEFLGTLEHPWRFDPTIFPEDASVEDIVAYIFEMQRQGKAFVVGGGNQPGARVVLRDESLGCDTGGEFETGFLPAGGFEIWTVEADVF